MSNSSTPVTNHVPGTSSEWQLYLILQRANLLQYYDTFISQGGDDVQQLLEAGEEEFLEIMALVGMASKPLHVRRLQKTLQVRAPADAQEFGANPTTFQLLALQKSGLVGSTSSVAQLIQSAAAAATISFCQAPSGMLHPSTLLAGTSGAGGSGAGSTGVAAVALAQSSGAAIGACQPAGGGSGATTTAGDSPGAATAAVGSAQSNGSGTASSMLWQQGSAGGGGGGAAAGDNSDFAFDSYNFSGASPMLTEGQICRLSECASALAKSLPEYEPKMIQNKKKIGRDLLNVMELPEEAPNRLDEFRKYAAIYGRFDAKRKADKPLTFHEVSVNEAAAQICLHRPALLTRRDELFPLARQVVRDAGYNYLKSGAPHRADNDGDLMAMELNRKRSTPAESLSSGGDKSPASCASNYSQPSPVGQQDPIERRSASPYHGVSESKKRRRIDDISLELSHILQEQEGYKLRVDEAQDLDELHDIQRELQRLTKRQLELTDEQAGLQGYCCSTMDGGQEELEEEEEEEEEGVAKSAADDAAVHRTPPSGSVQEDLEE